MCPPPPPKSSSQVWAATRAPEFGYRRTATRWTDIQAPMLQDVGEATPAEADSPPGAPGDEPHAGEEPPAGDEPPAGAAPAE